MNFRLITPQAVPCYEYLWTIVKLQVIATPACEVFGSGHGDLRKCWLVNAG